MKNQSSTVVLNHDRGLYVDFHICLSVKLFDKSNVRVKGCLRSSLRSVDL